MANTTRSRSELKRFFVRNAIPTESNFADLVDAQLNQSDDGIFKLPDQPLAVVAAPGEQRRVLQLYADYPAANPDWLLSLQPRLMDGSRRTTAALGIAGADGTTRLLLSPEGNLAVAHNLAYGGRLSKLDTDENVSAVVRAADFTLGYSTRRGTPGRALVDNKDTLVVNFARDWPAIRLDSPVSVSGDLTISGTRLRNSTGLAILEANAADWLRVNPDGNYPSIALYQPVAIGTGGLSVGDWTQMPQGQLRVTGAAGLLGGVTVSGGSALKDGVSVTGNAGLLNLTGVDHSYIQFYPRGTAQGRNAWIGYGNAGSKTLTIASESGDLNLASSGGNVVAGGGAVLNGIGIGTQVHGATTWPYETIQLNPAHNLRIWFGATQRFVLSSNGQFQMFFDQGTWVFQADGNLVKYNKAGAAIWSINNLANRPGW